MAGAVEAAIALRCEALRVDAEWVPHRLVALAMTSVGDFFTLLPDGNLVLNAELADPERGAAMKKLEVTELPDSGRRIRIELFDKIKALDLIGRHVGMEHRQETQDDGLGLDDRIQEARIRSVAGRSPSGP